MKFFLLLSLCFGLATGMAIESDEETSARKTALDLAGAFSNDGFKLRDGHWSGTLEPGKARLIQVNLFAGNAYWISVGSNGKAKKLALRVYDETGELIPVDLHEEGHRVAAGFSPRTSGPCYIKVEAIEGAPTAFCLIYSYK
jgi:hypothetical protein